MRTLLAVATVLGLLLPSPGSAQGIAEVMEAIRVGGGWISLPVEGGRAKMTTMTLPSAGRTLRGCLEIWPGHTGRWLVKVTDTYGNGRIEADARPADDIPFTYTTGMMAQLDVEVQWSEPRDTTLMVWVGLHSPRRDRDPCEPVYPETGNR